MAYRFTHAGYHAIFFKINKYQLLYCILQYAHAGTWLTLVKNWRFFEEEKTVSWKIIHDLEDSFSDKSLWLSINRPCLLREMYVFTLVRNRGAICAVTPSLILPIQGVY